MKNAQERGKSMKRWTKGALLLAAALATGCVAQIGQGEDPGSTSEQLTGEQAAPAPAVPQKPQDRTHLRVLQPSDGRLGEVRDEQGAAELRLNSDPSDPVTDDGDGREPDPHPWHGNNITLAH